MPFPADFETYARTRLFIAAGLPTDNTEAAFETKTGWKEFTITAVGAIQGRAYNTSELDVVSQGQIRRKKGNYQLPDSEWGVVASSTDPAYLLADAGMRSDAIYSFALVRQSGAVIYFTAQVMNLAEPGGGSNDSLTYNMPLLLQTEAILSTTPIVPTVTA